MKKLLATLCSLTLLSQIVLGDVVYVTATTSNCTSTTICGNGANQDINPNTGFFIYSDVLNPSPPTTTAISTVSGKPPTPGARYFSTNFTNSNTEVGITINPALGVPGGVYRLYHVYSSAAGNVSTNVIMGITNVDGCTISVTNTDKFQRSYGTAVGGFNVWQFLTFVTNSPAGANPVIRLYYVAGEVNSGSNNRLVVDTFRLELYNPCQDVPNLGVTGPLNEGSSTVTVTGVSNAAVKITVYQDSGAGMVSIGERTSDIVSGNNSVTVTGLVKGAQVVATQTLGTQEGCVATSGLLVGGGANPRLRVVLSIRESTNTGPVGVAGSTAGVGANIHFLGASTRINGAPGNGPVLTPANTWQTLTFDRGTALIGNSGNAAGVVADGPGYNANDTVAIRVYAYRTVPESGVTIFSKVPAQSSTVTSNDTFSVNWTWDAVAGADGYRLLRSHNSDNYTNSSVDVGANNYTDVNAWAAITPVTPTQSQTNASVKWNAATGSTPVGTTYDLQGQWGTLDAIAFAIDDLSDTGPYDLYIDNIQNGSTVFQTFENAVGNATGYGLLQPSFSGTTSGNILGTPNSSRVSIRAADTGSKSLHVKFQWNGTNDSKWLRLTTSTAVPVQNPQINLNDPTSIRFLLLPVGGTLPPQPAAPTLAISNNVAGQRVLSWTGAHNLQAASVVSGTYTNVPSVTTSPWTNTFTEPEKFFRLSDPYDN